MFTRVVQGTFNPDTIEEAREKTESEVLNTLRRSAGFVDLISGIDPDTGRFVMLSVWRTREDAERFTQNETPRLLELLQAYLVEQPTFTLFELDNSTIHKVARGKAA